MKKIIYLIISVLVYSAYLVYSYNNFNGRSYIFEPIFITLEIDLPENSGLKLVYQTINDPTKGQEATFIHNDTIPLDTYIFKIDSSYRISNFSIYFQSLNENDTITIRQIKASNGNFRGFPFSLRSKDLIATDNLELDQLSDHEINIRKIASPVNGSSALIFNTRSSFNEVSLRTNIRIPEIPRLLSFLLIVCLGLLMTYLLYPMITNQNLEGISLGAYILALTALLLPTGEKVCNLLLAISVLAGIFSGIRTGIIREQIRENRRLLLLTVIILLVYAIGFLFPKSDAPSGNLMVVKLGLPLTFVAIAFNTTNKQEIRIQYVALLSGVIISVFIHFGWIVMLVDTVEIKARLLSNPHHYLETSVFSRVHHSYLSVIYLMGLVVIFFNKYLVHINKKEVIIYSSVIITALLFAFSRAAMLSMVFLLIFFASRRILQLRKLEISHAARIFTSAALTIVLLVFLLFDFNLDTASNVNSMNSVRTRIYVWENAINLIKQKPLFGWGPNHYESALQKGNEQYIINSNTWGSLNTHNQILETSGMFGLVVGVGLIWFLFFPTGFMRKNWNFPEIIFCTAIIFITGFLFESFLNRNLGILIFGIVYGLLIKLKPE